MEFGVSTNDDETDFHFDFDQDADVCSYVNTTMQSEERRSIEMQKHNRYIEDNLDKNSKKAPHEQMEMIREVTRESYHGGSSNKNLRNN